MSDDTKQQPTPIGTCVRCGWPTYEQTKDGCTPTNCCVRPLPPAPTCIVYGCDNDSVCIGPDGWAVCNDHRNHKVAKIADQPPSSGDIWRLVIADMEARRLVGIERYGTPLQARNGRDALMDGYQEALDLCAYLRQAIEERKS